MKIRIVAEKWRWLLLAALLLVCCVGRTEAGNVSLVENDPQSFSTSLYYYLDSGHRLTLGDVLHDSGIPWVHAKTASPNFGFVRGALWLKLDLPHAQQNARRLFEIANHKITNATVFLLHRSGSKSVLDRTYTITDSMPVRERPYSSQNYVFPLELKTGVSQFLYIRLQNDYPMKLPLNLWTLEQYQDQREARALFQGMYFGVVVIMAIYNLCIYLFVRDRSYGTYAVFILCLAGYVLVDRGIAVQYLWPDNPTLDFRMTMVFTALGCGFSVPFTVSFLSLKENAPRIASAYRLLFWLWMLIAFVAMVYPAVWLPFIVLLVLLPGGTSLFVVGVLMWRRGVPAAPYYTVAWAVLVGAAIIYDSLMLGFVPESLFTEYSLQVGNMIEVTLPTCRE